MSSSSFRVPFKLNDQPVSYELRNSRDNWFEYCLTNLKTKEATEFSSECVRFQVEPPKLIAQRRMKYEDLIIKMYVELTFLWSQSRSPVISCGINKQSKFSVDEQKTFLYV